MKVSRTTPSKSLSPQQRAVFTKIDTDGNGQLDKDELRAYFADYADESVATALIAALDSDGDGTVDFNEFCSEWSQFFGEDDNGHVASVASVAAAVRLHSSMRGQQVHESLGTIMQPEEAATTIQAAMRRWMTGLRVQRAVHSTAADQQAKQRLQDDFAERQQRHRVRSRNFEHVPSDSISRLAETAMTALTSKTSLGLQEWAQDLSKSANPNSKTDRTNFCQHDRPNLRGTRVRGLYGRGGDSVQHAETELWYDHAKERYTKLPAGQREGELAAAAAAATPAAAAATGVGLAGYVAADMTWTTTARPPPRSPEPRTAPTRPPAPPPCSTD